MGLLGHGGWVGRTVCNPLAPHPRGPTNPWGWRPNSHKRASTPTGSLDHREGQEGATHNPSLPNLADQWVAPYHPTPMAHWAHGGEVAGGCIFLFFLKRLCFAKLFMIYDYLSFLDLVSFCIFYLSYCSFL